MENTLLNVSAFIIGITLTVIGVLCTFILSKISADLKEALTKIEVNSTDIAILKLQVSSKLDKLECVRCKL